MAAREGVDGMVVVLRQQAIDVVLDRKVCRLGVDFHRFRCLNIGDFQTRRQFSDALAM